MISVSLAEESLPHGKRLGSSPFIRRKRRLKVDKSLNPRSNAMVDTASSDRRRRTAARWRRVCSTNWCGVMPTTCQERPQEMIRAHRCFACDIRQRKMLFRVRLDFSQRLGDAPLVASARRTRGFASTDERAGHHAGKTQRQFLELRAIVVVARGSAAAMSGSSAGTGGRRGTVNAARRAAGTAATIDSR